MPYVPAGSLTSKELKVHVPSGAAIPGDEALEKFALLGVGCRDHEHEWLVSVSLGVCHPGSVPQDTPSALPSTWAKSSTMRERRARGISLGWIRANPASPRFVTLASAPVVI